MTQTVRFTSTALRGYGFDLARDLVVSYKRDKSGQYLDKRTSYNLNYNTQYHEALRRQAREQAGLQGTPFTQTVAALKAQAIHPDAHQLTNLRPSFPYVLYSKKNQCSQYFFANTPVSQALTMLAKRGEIVALEDVRILNVDTGTVSLLKPKKVITEYVLA